MKHKYGKLQMEHCYRGADVSQLKYFDINILSTIFFQPKLYIKKDKIFVIKGNKLYNNSGISITFKVEDIATPANPNGKYRSSCNDPTHENKTTYQQSMCDYNSARLTDYTFKRNLNDDQLARLVKRNPVVVMLNVSRPCTFLYQKKLFLTLFFWIRSNHCDITPAESSTIPALMMGI